MEITEHTVVKMTDPMGILSGERYEFRLYIMLDEDDELYTEDGIGIRALFVVDGEEQRMASYHFFERATENVLDFEMEDDEQAMVIEFCKTHLPE